MVLREAPWSHGSHTHTSAASWPHPVARDAGSSASVHSRAPYSRHRASACSQVAAERQPPMLSDEWAHTP